MLQYIRYIIFLLVCISFFLFSCEKDADQQLELIDLVPEPTEKVFATVQGLVLNEQEEIVESAEVFILEKATRTDENGFFTLEGFFPLDGTPIRVRKAGYFESNGIILPQADGIIKVNIILVEQEQTETTETGRIINHQTDQISVLFPQDVFVHQNGAIVQGMINISSQYFDPTDQGFADSQLGFLKSKSLAKSELLFPFGLLKINVTDESARSVAISQAVEITMDVPTDLLDIAPTSVSMWYLDTETGLWVEEGSAQLEGTAYKGSVTHLSDWVFAIGLDYVLLTGQITKEGISYPYADVGVSYRAGSRFRFRSDEQGHFSLPIIIGGEQYNTNYFETINVDVRSNCGTILFEEKIIPPPTEDFTKDIDVSSSSTFAITGQVFCTDPTEIVSNAYVLIQFDENKYQEIVPVNEQGQFRLEIEACGLSEVRLIGYDVTTLNRSESVVVTETNTTVAINVCEAPFEPKVTFEINEEAPYIIDNCTVEIIDSIDFWHYQFTALDLYPTFPEAEGDSAIYIINVFKPKDEGVEVPAQLWRYTQPDVSRFDVPYSIAFGTWTFEIISETEDQVIAQIPLGENYPGNQGAIFKYDENGSEIIDVISGSVLLEANK